MANTPQTETFAQFKAKRNEWLKWFSGTDRNSIMNQIYRMIWNGAVFRVINEARRLASPIKDDAVAMNGMVHRFINDCFYASQCNAIRRLLDKETSTGKRSVYSLYRLIDDIENNAILLTREHILAAEELEYDYERIRQAWNEEERKIIQSGKTSWWTPREYDWEISANRHKDLDRLAGVDRDNRSPGDPIQQGIPARLKLARQSCESIFKHVNKFVAHAASPESRAADNAADLSITLGDLWKAHATICKIANFISVFILSGTSQGFLPTLRGDEFQYIDRPLVEAKGIKRLEEVWEEYWQETLTWTNWGWDGFAAEAG